MSEARAPSALTDSPPFELRLLTGVHAGASLTLSPGESVTIGRSRSCDVVLHDAPFDKARLEAGEAGWLWHEPDGTRQAIPTGWGLSAGSLVLTVQSHPEPWAAPDDLQIAWVRPASPDAVGIGMASAGMSKATDDASVASGPDTDSGGIAAAAPGAPSSPGSSVESEPMAQPSIPLPSESEGRPRRWLDKGAWMLAPGAVLVAMAWYAAGLTDPFLSLFRQPGADAPVVAAPAAPSGASQGDFLRVSERIASAGFNDVLRASLRPDGRIEVTGVLDGVDEQDQVVQLLSPERRWIALALLTQREFAERVRDASRQLPEGFSAEALAGGRVRITGLMLSPEDGARARSIVEERLPQAVAIVNGFTTPADTATQWAGELKDLGFTSVKVAWRDARISIEGMISRERAASWEQALLGFNQRYGDRLPTRVALTLSDPSGVTVAATVVQAVLPPPRLPRIVAIQSGPLSYLLFADGVRVLPGGTVNGYRLTEIGDAELVFEDPNGVQHKVPR